MNTLFDINEANFKPLADKMRPTNLDEFYNQYDLFDISMHKIPTFKERINKAKLEFESFKLTVELAKIIFPLVEIFQEEGVDEKEIYWITYYNTFKGIGYNCSAGGGNNRGENNGRTKLTNQDVAYIRDCYDEHMRRKEVYEQFKGRP